jgi:acyl-CoA synthetase (AMP-forming)/AMP-acid ligase II
VAVSSATREVTYAEFVRDIEQVARYLYQQSLPGNGLVAVLIADAYIHWLMVLALARLGCASVSIQPTQQDSLPFLKADLVLTDHALEAVPFLLVSLEGIAAASSAVLPELASDVDIPLRVVMSSGTTGDSKKILLMQSMLQRRINNILFVYDISSKTRYLDVVPITTICGFHVPLATWTVGGTVVLWHPQFDRYKNIVRHRVNLMFASPIILTQLLSAMPRYSAPIDGLRVFVGGSVLPQAINFQARLRLTSALFIIYGSTEASVTAYAHASVADSSSNASGYVLPFAEVQILNAAGQPVAAGEIGEVRIKSEGCVSAYLDESPLNAEIFREGWFYPGDSGFLDKTGLLHIIGRTRYLMNLGGFKISPDSIENALRDFAGVADIAAFAMEDRNGIAQPCVFIVAKDGFQKKEIIANFHQKFPDLPSLYVFEAAEIPRNDMGKIQRKDLAGTARDIVKRSSAADGI